MKASELLQLLREFHRDKLNLYRRHIAAARHVRDYDINNTYQYIIAREEMQLGWVADAITGMDGQLDDVPESNTGATASPSGKGDSAQKSIVAQDRDAATEFLAKWQPRVDAMTHARHKNMLRVILGETVEQKRFFEQAIAGRTDLLGRRADGAGTEGDVLATRWIE